MSKDHAYAYEAGYRDGSVHYELEHCPACKNVADLQEALEENATLRQQLADVTVSMGRVEERCAKLREKIKALTELASIGKLTASQCTELAEDNAKLRELLQRALTSHNKICTNRGTCAGCLLFKAKPLAPVCPIISVTRDARELGVEVDDA